MGRLAATILTGLLLAALSAEKASAEAPFGEWRIAGIAGDPVTGEPPTLTIEATGYNGSSGCNHYFGNVIVEGPAITFGPAGSTRMMCADPALMDQETALFAVLVSIKTWQSAGNALHLFDQTGVPVLVLISTAAPAPTPANAFVIPVPDPVDVATRSYVCDKIEVTVDYLSAGGLSLAVLHFADEIVIAANVLSASGARYAGGRYIWWSHGDATDLYDLTGPGGDTTPIPCTEMIRAIGVIITP